MTSQIYQRHLVRKRFGQNFLTSQVIINDIIAAINPKKEDVMIEIGPGLAALTKPVCEHLLNKLIVIELDRNLAARLQMHPLLGPKLIIYQKDVMDIDFEELSKNFNQPLRIFGNLPYNISTLLIFHLFKYIHVISDMHFMLQKEVADRLIAKTNKKTYGRLSIIAQYYCHIIPILQVPSNAFVPPPKVESTLVRLVPHTKILYPVEELYALKFVITKAFNQRRKTIRNSLVNLLTIKEFSLLEIDPSIRAEDISVTQYCQIANYIFNKNKLKNIK